MRVCMWVSYLCVWYFANGPNNVLYRKSKSLSRFFSGPGSSPGSHFLLAVLSLQSPSIWNRQISIFVFRETDVYGSAAQLFCRMSVNVGLSYASSLEAGMPGRGTAPPQFLPPGSSGGPSIPLLLMFPLVTWLRGWLSGFSTFIKLLMFRFLINTLWSDALRLCKSPLKFSPTR